MPTEVHLSKLIQEYNEQGYILLPQVLPGRWIDDLLERYMGLVREVTGDHLPIHRQQTWSHSMTNTGTSNPRSTA